MTPSLLSDITTHLTGISDTPALDASVLLANISGKHRTWILAHPEITLTAEQQNRLNRSLQRLQAGEPFPYVLGHWEFFGLDFEVTPDVLIPRPETELLVEKAIAWLQKFPSRRSVADIGTGSGAIAISIAVNVPDANILATDISEKALLVAKQNAQENNVGHRIRFTHCDLLPELQSIPADDSSFTIHHSYFDLLCANLPYIPSETLYTLPIYGREPTLALDGGSDGLDLVRRLLQIAPQWLTSNGLILLEIEATRGTQALNLGRELFPKAQVQVHPDLTGNDRLIEISL